MKEKRGDAFSDCHPAVNFFWFAAVILITMLNSHPVFLGISFLGAFCYASRLQGWQRVLKFNLLATLPAMIIVAFINPAFNHYGVTMLFYLKTGPVTLEAIVYGLVLASMLFISILWFSCYNKVMTTDKFVYLFGRVIPALSLVLFLRLFRVWVIQAACSSNWKTVSLWVPRNCKRRLRLCWSIITLNRPLLP